MAQSKPKPERLPWSRLFFLLFMGSLLVLLGTLVRPHGAEALAEIGQDAVHARSLRSDSQVVGDAANRMHWTNWVEFFGYSIAAVSVLLAVGKTAVSKKT